MNQYKNDEKENLMLELANLELDSKVGKDRHFIAADRKNRLRNYLGVFSVVGTVFLSSQAMKETFTSLNLSYDIALTVVSFLVSVSTSVLGFFGLEKQVTQHNFIGNKYIEISRRASYLMSKLATISDDANLMDIRKDFEFLLEKYLEINKEGESYPTNNKDSKKAFERNENDHKKIKQKKKDTKYNFLNIKE